MFRHILPTTLILTLSQFTCNWGRFPRAHFLKLYKESCIRHKRSCLFTFLVILFILFTLPLVQTFCPSCFWRTLHLLQCAPQTPSQSGLGLSAGCTHGSTCTRLGFSCYCILSIKNKQRKVTFLHIINIKCKIAQSSVFYPTRWQCVQENINKNSFNNWILSI